MEENYFKKLYALDLRSKTDKKNGLDYLRWAAAWSEAKKEDPNADYYVHKDTMVITTDNGAVTKARPWFDDGKTAWVEVTVTIHGVGHTEILPIMDYKNNAIPADNVKSTDANKSIQRAITKACARHGIGLYLYESEDIPEETKKLAALKPEVMKLMKDKAALSKKTASRVEEVCKEVLAEENGNPNICDDPDKIETLKKKLLAIRKIAD